MVFFLVKKRPMMYLCKLVLEVLVAQNWTISPKCEVITEHHEPPSRASQKSMFAVFGVILGRYQRYWSHHFDKSFLGGTTGRIGELHSNMLNSAFGVAFFSSVVFVQDLLLGMIVSFLKTRMGVKCAQRWKALILGLAF